MGSGSVQECSAACTSICNEIAKVAGFQEDARLADAMYQPMGQRNVPGFTEVTDPNELAALDLTVDDLNPQDSQFRAGVFRRDGTDDYVVGFKGTTFSSPQDWMENFRQGLGRDSDYYRRAGLIGRDVGSNAGQGGIGDVKFVGHSLGGGLASMASHSSGLPATTFNASGLHRNNQATYNVPAIDSVRVNGEVLTSIQGFLGPMPQAVGTPYQINPPAATASVMSRANLRVWDALRPKVAAVKYAAAAIARAVELHQMPAVHGGLEEHAAALQAQAAASGCSC